MSRFLILMYHLIRPPRGPNEVRYACPPKQFYRHLAWLKAHRPLISLAQIEAAFAGKTTLPDGAVAITLDDGHGDNYTQAFPIAQELGVPITIFLATGYLGRTNSWMRGFSQYPMLTREQIREMHRHGVAFGAHTVTHPRLMELPSAQVRQELLASKNTIEDALGVPCCHFAYPYGALDETVRNLVAECGYTLACATRSGFNHLERDPLVLHRIEVYGNDSVLKLRLKATFGTHEGSIFLPVRYYTHRLIAKLHR